MKAYALPAAIIALAVAILAGVFFYNSLTAVGSVLVGNEYQANQLTSADASSTVATTVKTRFGSIGSIVVASGSPATTLTFYDTAGTATTTTSTTTILFTFNPNVDDGTYQFDVGFNRGLLVEVPSLFDGDFVITYR